MSFLNVKNNASSILAAGIDAVATSLTVAAGEGARFPASNFHITIEDEILLCTTRTGDVLTVTRAQEGTAAAAHAAAKAVRLNITAAIIQELQDQASLPQLTLAKAYLGTNQEDIAAGTNPRVELDTISFDLGNNFKTGDWYGASGAYRQSDADSDATHIRDDDANFPAAIFGALVKWASNAAGTLNTGVGYVGGGVTADALTIIKTSGADFAASYYYWIKKAYYLVPLAGYYPCFFQMQYVSGVEADKRYGVYVFVNGVQSICALFHASVANMMRLPHNGVLYLQQGDIVTLHGYTESPNGTVDFGSGLGNTVMSIFCLQRA
jgi:hypothetical protein